MQVSTKAASDNSLNKVLCNEQELLHRGVDIWFFPLGSILLTHCCHNIVDTPFTNTALDFSRKISKEKNDILFDLQTSDKNTHQYIFLRCTMYNHFFRVPKFRSPSLIIRYIAFAFQSCISEVSQFEYHLFPFKVLFCCR